jgi:hypothetical protein
MADETQYFAEIIITNKTDYFLVLEGYHKSKLQKKIEIKPKGANKSLINVGKVVNFMGLGDNLDSVTIKFGNTKYITQYCNGKDLSFCPGIPKNLTNEFERISNPLGPLKFQLKRTTKRIYRKPIELIIDQSDYDRAVPIKN